MKLRVQENERYVRDTNNLAVLNTDSNALKKHEMKLAQLQRQKTNQEELNTLKNEISELKQMMQELIKRI